MKIALLSDIHANHFALRAVLAAVDVAEVDVILIGGDFIGYYFWPTEVLELLGSRQIVAVSGNHERMLARTLTEPDYKLQVEKKYGTGLSLAIELLDDRAIHWLLDLPESRIFETGHGALLLCHGSPWERDQYVYPDVDASLVTRYADYNVKWIVQGHTHYSMNRSIGDVTVINPGSVGQPRNRLPGAHWALLDSETGAVTQHTEEYDRRQLIAEARRRHPELPYLANVLERL